MQKVAIIASVAATSLASSGEMSVIGSGLDGGCEYADATDGGTKSPAATSPHIVSGRYCGVNLEKYAEGAGCGACYNVSYSGEGGTDKGRAGWEVVQVVNIAENVDFACNKDVFESITGASTGIFPVTYHKMACEVDSSVGVASVLDGNNAYYTKAIFSDLPYAVSSAKLKIGSKSFPMSRVAGATFKASTDGTQASASFELTLADGSINKMAPCFTSWPVTTDSSCAPAAAEIAV